MYVHSGQAVTQSKALVGASFVPAQAFGYDQQRSLTAVGKYDAAGLTIPTTVCLVHDALGRLTAVGPALARLSGPGATACEKEGDLASVTVRFHYDAMNRRVARQDGNGWIEYVHDPSANLLAEVTRPATAGGAWSTKREYVWLDGQPLAQLEYPGPAGRTDGYTYYFHLDHLGQPRALTGESGATVWSAGPARPYGDVAEATWPDSLNGRTVVTNLRLPGQHDEKLFAAMGMPELKGPYYNWNRWYLPTMGRYMELDPIAVAGGFNGEWGPEWYTYLAGNPLSGIDPDGLEKLKICLAKKLLTLLSDDGKERMKADVVTGCTSTPTPTGKYRLGNWMKDPTTSLWGEDSKLRWSEDFWGRNVFGPWFVPLQNGDGVGIHGHYGPFTGDLGFLLGKLRSRCSHGCIRLSNDNITLLHDLLPKPLGTPVDITADCE